MQSETQPPNDWQLEINPPPETVETLRENLQDYNRQAGQTNEAVGLGIFLRDDDERLIGGVSGWLWGSTLEVNFLWLDETMRGQGFGHQLMTRIEEAAVDRGATKAVLSTFTFQSPDFYQSLGYEVTAVIDGLGNDHKKIYFRKSL